MLESSMIDIRQIKELNCSKFIKIILHPFLRIYGPHRIGRLISKTSQRCGDTNSHLVGNIVWGYGDEKKETLNQNDIAEFTQVLFEGNNVSSYSCWDKFLTNVYKNYMAIPKDSSKKSHDIKAWKCNY